MYCSDNFISFRCVNVSTAPSTQTRDQSQPFDLDLVSVRTEPSTSSHSKTKQSQNPSDVLSALTGDNSKLLLQMLGPLLANIQN